MAEVFQEYNLKTIQQVEQELKEWAPPVLYKYRSCSDVFHQKMIYNAEIYFAHPKTLDDPFDIRIPMEFNLAEIENPAFYEKLKEIASIIHPEVAPNSRDFNIICQNQLDFIKLNPEKYFQENYKIVRESNLFDAIGVFSLSENPLIPQMWAAYGDNFKGICIGFDTVELYKYLKVAFGKTEYVRTPIQHSFLDPDGLGPVELFIKHETWKYQEEYRFVTNLISLEEDRKKTLPIETVKEVIVGNMISKECLTSIIEILQKRYCSKVALFSIEESTNAYTFSKNPIGY